MTTELDHTSWAHKLGLMSNVVRDIQFISDARDSISRDSPTFCTLFRLSQFTNIYLAAIASEDLVQTTAWENVSKPINRFLSTAENKLKRLRHLVESSCSLSAVACIMDALLDGILQVVNTIFDLEFCRDHDKIQLVLETMSQRCCSDYPLNLACMERYLRQPQSFHSNTIESFAMELDRLLAAVTDVTCACISVSRCASVLQSESQTRIWGNLCCESQHPVLDGLGSSNLNLYGCPYDPVQLNSRFETVNANLKLYERKLSSVLSSDKSEILICLVRRLWLPWHMNNLELTTLLDEHKCKQVEHCGAFGTIYKGVVELENEEMKGIVNVAVGYMRYQMGVGDFLRRISLMHEVVHPCLVRLIGAKWDESQDNISCIMVTEYTEMDLAKAISSSKLQDHADILTVVRSVAEGLSYLHQKGIPHMNLQPANILLCNGPDGLPYGSDVKLTNYGTQNKGSCKHSDQGGHMGISSSSTYVAPELEQSGNIPNPQSDVYSFGVLMCDVLGLRPIWHKSFDTSPESAADFPGILNDIKQSLGIHALKEFRNIAHSCLHPDPAHRPQMNEILWKFEVISRGDASLVSLRACNRVQLPASEMLEIASDYNNSMLGERRKARLASARTMLAAAAGDTRALATLGTHYSTGSAVERDSCRAFHLYHQAAAAGDVDALLHLCDCHVKGIGVNPNSKIAFLLCSQTARLTCDIRVLRYLASMYFHGVGTTRNVEKAAALHRQAALLGSAESRLELGLCYQNGQGVAQNSVLAYSLIQLAAESSVNALHCLGDCYMNGEGVPRCSRLAFNIYKKAADLGNLDSLNCLGASFMNADGALLNFSEAFSHFERAARGNHRGALQNLGLCYENGLGCQKDPKMAFKLYVDAVNAGNTDAYYDAGRCFETGQGVAQSDDMAYLYFRIAADMGHREAANKLRGLPPS